MWLSPLSGGVLWTLHGDLSSPVDAASGAELTDALLTDGVTGQSISGCVSCVRGPEAHEVPLGGFEDVEVIACAAFPCHTLPQLAIAWIAEQGVLPIIGAQVPEHIESSVVAADIDLDQ